eukprot:TRINITY_DN8959_c0_g1_i1.p1 TRINITY_DN8959_c0_g1~~TRINITY_DN8959_c0_g1_i1.p1  ORF type:complete len:885 (+),score=167.81 TRINITY_DN8959_c0_g1_i1:160-2814(+)
MHQAFLERMEQMRQTAGTSPNLPAGARHSDGMAQPSAQVSFQRLVALEATIKEVTLKLDEWSQVTRAGLADVRHEIGQVKLEHRFAQTFRTTTSTNPTPTATDRSEDSSAAQASINTQLTEKCDALERQLHDALSVSSRIAEVELELKEEKGRRSLLFDRLTSIEACCQELRNDQEGLATLQSATEKLLRGEIHRNVEVLRDDLDFSRKASEEHGSIVSQTGQSVAELQRSFDDASKHMAEVDQKLCELQRLQAADATALRSQVENAVRVCDRQVSSFDELRSQIQEEKRRFEELQACFRDFERNTAAAREQDMKRLERLDMLEVSYKDMRTNSAPISMISSEVAGVQSAVSQELADVREELQQFKAEQSSSLMQLEQSNVSLTRNQEECDRKLVELKQDHLSEMVALRGRIEDTVGDVHAQQHRLGGVEGQLEEARQRQIVDVDALTSRIDRLDQSAKTSAASIQGTPLDSSANDTRHAELVDRVHDLEEASRQAHTYFTQLGSKVTNLEKTCFQNEAADHLRVHSQAAGEQLESELSGLQSEVTNCRNDLGQLADELHKMRKEHDLAISNLGALTETVAKTATEGIQRAEERIEKTVSSQQNHADGTITDLGDAQSEPLQVDLCSFIKDLHQKTMARIEIADSKISSVEKSFGSDTKYLTEVVEKLLGQLEVMQVELSQRELRKQNLTANVTGSEHANGCVICPSSPSVGVPRPGFGISPALLSNSSDENDRGSQGSSPYPRISTGNAGGGHPLAIHRVTSAAQANAVQASSDGSLRSGLKRGESGRNLVYTQADDLSHSRGRGSLSGSLRVGIENKLQGIASNVQLILQQQPAQPLLASHLRTQSPGNPRTQSPMHHRRSPSPRMVLPAQMQRFPGQSQRP